MNKKPHFNGPYYDPALDHDRLTKQIGRVYALMADGFWRTLNEMSDKTGDPQASISAQLRHLRKPRFGGYEVEVRRRGDRTDGLFEYRLITKKEQKKSEEPPFSDPPQPPPVKGKGQIPLFPKAPEFHRTPY